MKTQPTKPTQTAFYNFLCKKIEVVRQFPKTDPSFFDLVESVGFWVGKKL